MPTLARLPDCTITMYAADHLPPHFHVRYKDGREALIEIASLAVLKGPLAPRELAGALAWANAHASVLHAKWKELNP